jgi:hypothetical protein
MTSSPYLQHHQRLPEILAAIQVMGTHKWDMLEVPDWQQRLGEPSSGDSWDDIFSDHPEFFQVREKPSDDPEQTKKKRFWVLTWRFAYDPYFDPDAKKQLSSEQVRDIPKNKKLARKPLEEEQIATLLNTAIELQVRAAAFEERRRWLITAAISFITTVIVVILGALLK